MKFANCEIPLFRRHVLAVMDCEENDGLDYLTRYCRDNSGHFAELQKENATRKLRGK